MRRLIMRFVCCILCLSVLFGFSVYAEEKDNSEEKNTVATQTVTEDNSTPRLMVTDYKLSKKRLAPGSKAVLTVNFKNYSSSKSLYNLKFSLSDSSGEIITTGMPTKYVKKISAGSTYKWEIELSAINTASVGQHDLNITVEYEDKYYNPYTASDIVRIDVRQSAKLEYSGAQLPKKVVQDSTETVAVELRNTGKSKLYNCSVDFDIEKLSSGGSVYVGDLEQAQTGTATAHLRVDSSALGETKGKIIVKYEDDYGKVYTQEVEVSTLIEEKVDAPIITDKNDEDEKGNNLWWVFILIGLIFGIGMSFGITVIVKDKKQRKEDDLRL